MIFSLTVAARKHDRAFPRNEQLSSKKLFFTSLVLTARGNIKRNSRTADHGERPRDVLKRRDSIRTCVKSRYGRLVDKEGSLSYSNQISNIKLDRCLSAVRRDQPVSHRCSRYNGCSIQDPVQYGLCPRVINRPIFDASWTSLACFWNLFLRWHIVTWKTTAPRCCFMKLHCNRENSFRGSFVVLFHF